MGAEGAQLCTSTQTTTLIALVGVMDSHTLVWPLEFGCWTHALRVVAN